MFKILIRISSMTVTCLRFQEYFRGVAHLFQGISEAFQWFSRSFRSVTGLVQGISLSFRGALGVIGSVLRAFQELKKYSKGFQRCLR